ncbi:DinB family protein [Nocardioides sp. W7]|uniref:DinB family protein n=1 Tax=Nocardioides sp. W7 TaxID=2931390 RepID=UPI001FD40FF2|nr:DinB family protein [Nocardioides sp. W7]
MDENELCGATVREVDLTGTRFVGVQAETLELSGEFGRLLVNGVDVVPLVSAELDRRHPERLRLRPTDVAGYREAFTVLEELWVGTVERARALDPALLDERVDGEWSFVETLRHLVFATECWVGRALLGDPSPWHSLSLPCDGMEDAPGAPRDLAARPALGEVLELRADRQATVHRALEAITDEQLTMTCTVPDGVGWPPAGEVLPVREPFDVVINEEWWHRQFAERDLAVLVSRQEQS